MHDEIGNLLVTRLRGELLDGVAAVVEPVRLLVRQRYAGFVDDYAVQSARNGFHSDLRGS